MLIYINIYIYIYSLTRKSKYVHLHFPRRSSYAEFIFATKFVVLPTKVVTASIRVLSFMLLFSYCFNVTLNSVIKLFRVSFNWVALDSSGVISFPILLIWFFRKVDWFPCVVWVFALSLGDCWYWLLLLKLNVILVRQLNGWSRHKLFNQSYFLLFNLNYLPV